MKQLINQSFNETINLDCFQFQRYFISEEHYAKGGPVFLMLGGEREANPAWLQNGHWVRQALVHKAMLIYLEHRYYGQSRPTA